MYDHFSDILAPLSLGSTSTSDPTRIAFDRVSPLKGQMNLDIPNLEGKIDTKLVDNWNPTSM